jgi:hypothetical protein
MVFIFQGKDNQYLQEFERYQNKELKMVIGEELLNKPPYI